MKNCALSLRKVCLALVLGLALHSFVQAQDVTTNTATIAYDTTLTSNGFGMFSLSFPQFSPDSGNLVAVRLMANVSSQYGFTLRNADTVSATYGLLIGQQDQITSPQLAAPYSNVTTQQLGNFPMNANQSMTRSPFAFLTNYTAGDTITKEVAPFLGGGLINLNYQSFTFSNLNSVNNAAYYYSANIATNVTFTVQYIFQRSESILATDLTAWTANQGGPSTIRLNWATANESTGRNYVIQRSSDGQHFNDIATLPSTADNGAADYSYPDELSGNADSSWSYRLQIHSAIGQVSYSPVRKVMLASEGQQQLKIYPNPASAGYINVVADQQRPADWQVDILSMSGSLIERDTYMQTATMQVNFHNKMSPGAYILRATDLRGQKMYTSTFVVLGQ